MSTPYPRKPDPLSLAAIDDALLDAAVSEARSHARRRAMVRLHEFDEPVQRMLNAVEPESYVRPHRHVSPVKPEAFVVLRGSVLVVRFADDGTPVEGLIVSEDGPVRAAEVPGGAWHTFVSLRSGTVLFEVTQGPYDETTNKEFATWAPTQEEREAAGAFIAGLKARFEPEFPGLAAINQIEAEEDDIC